MATKKFNISKSESVRLLIKTCFENKVTQHAQIACVLANCQHETLNFVYSEEIDGRSQAKLLGYRGGIEYFGRGYIHLTHIDNYQKADSKLGLDGRITRNLDYATNPNIAAKTAVIGMRDGWFTGLGLKRWIDGDKGWITGDGLSYYYARQIVNGDFKTTNTSEIAKEWSLKIPSVVSDIVGYSVLSVSLVDIRETPIPDSLIEITVAKDSSFSQKYTTNRKGIIPYIYAPLNSTLEFKINNRTCKNKLVMNRKLKSITLVDSNCSFNTETQPHQVADNANDQKPRQLDKSDATSSELSETESGNQSIVDSISFNIKLVEADTSKPLPNAQYYLEYKNDIKPHKTNSSGVDSGIKADVSQSIGVYLDDDGGKKQSIYSMAFPVTGDLNGQTKVLKVPVVAFNIKFVNKNNQPIPHYEFKILYRGRQSAIKRANSQGISTIKALAGQKLTVIDGQGVAQTTAIVTYGSKQWTMMIGTNITEENISDVSDALSQGAPATSETSKQDETLKPETEQNPVTKVEKSEVKEVEKKTEEGPVLEVSNLAKITIKFVDEKTNKPLSGLSYTTQSDLYGKNTSVTGKDGARGRVHESKVGIEITVLAHEDGKEVKKGVITANTDKNDIPYVYKAKKSKTHNVEISFSDGTRSNVVTEKTKTILRELAQKYGTKRIVITSSLRTAEEQASAMYKNIAGGRVIGYRAPGAEVTRICQNGIKKGLSKSQVIKNMVSKILEYDKKGVRVSKHCVSFETYAKMNIVDLGINSNGFDTYAKKESFQKVCDEAVKQGKLSSFISPLRDTSEPAFHLEIPQ